MGKRSQARSTWPKRHDTATQHTVRVWICADCKARGCQLIACYDVRQRCPSCKWRFDRGERPMVPAAPPARPIIQPAGQLVRQPRVG